MFRTISSKFRAIAALLLLSLGLGNGLLAFFSHQQSEIFITSRTIAIIDRDFTKLNEMFHNARFWEKVIFSESTPDAERQYGILIKQIRSVLTDLIAKDFSQSIKSNLNHIVEQIDRYEDKFNHLIQLKTKQILTNTRMETNYRSMTSIVLSQNNPMMLKPMFNLSHFMMAYRHGVSLSKFKALGLVVDSFEKKVLAIGTIDFRMQGYLNDSRALLAKDYLIETDMLSTTGEVEEIASAIQSYFADISSELKGHLKSRLLETTKIREQLQTIFLFSGIAGVLFMIFLLHLFSRKLIDPIKAIALVMHKVKKGDITARFENVTKSRDETAQLGISFNEMLDTLEINNQKELNYQKELENKIDEISRQKKESRDLTDKLHRSQKMESMGALAGGIAHDFNNILSAIIGYTQLSMDEVEKGSLLEDNLGEVYTAGIRAKELVKQILAFARQSDEEMHPIQVDIIAREVLKFIRSSIPTSVEIQQDIDTDSVVMANSTQMHQIFMNLCTNAAHAMEENGGILKISMKDVCVDDKHCLENNGIKAGDYIEIKISDTGVGIPEDIVTLIFEPYFTTKKPGEGTGMGLAMVHGIVQSYGGTIAVNSKEGEGTVFTIHLPITKKRGEYFLHEFEDLVTGNERILFIDDELPLAMMVAQMLGRLNYQVTIRTSSVEALELFRSKSDDFDLVITDMTMPNMTGDVLAAELMKIRPDIPVIISTGYSKKITEKTAEAMGFRAFVYKPIIKRDLANIVRKVLDDA